MRHTFECQASTPNFRYPCGFSGCIQTFATFSGISSHLQSQHPNELLLLERDGDTEQDQTLLQQNTEDHDDERNDEISEQQAISTTDSRLLAQKSAALLLLTLKERHKVTQTAINFAVGQIQQMLKRVLEDVKLSVQNKLDSESRSNIEECNKASKQGLHQFKCVIT